MTPDYTNWGTHMSDVISRYCDGTAQHSEGSFAPRAVLGLGLFRAVRAFKTQVEVLALLAPQEMLEAEQASRKSARAAVAAAAQCPCQRSSCTTPEITHGSRVVRKQSPTRTGLVCAESGHSRPQSEARKYKRRDLGFKTVGCTVAQHRETTLCRADSYRHC